MIEQNKEFKFVVSSPSTVDVLFPFGNEQTKIGRLHFSGNILANVSVDLILIPEAASRLLEAMSKIQTRNSLAAVDSIRTALGPSVVKF